VISTVKDALTHHLLEHPRDLCAWAQLRDVLEMEEAPDEALKVCDQAGTWIGSRDDWERDGPLLVDRVPVVRVWVLDMAPLKIQSSGPFQGMYGWSQSSALSYQENVPEKWSEDLFDNSPDLAAAQSWLTQIALAYARRVRDEVKR
jgi:hypothetical protein